MNDMNSYKAVIRRIESAPEEVQDYFSHASNLIRSYPWEVSLAWMFSRVELAQNNCLYCAAVKLHRTDSMLTRDAIDAHYMSRRDFRDFYRTIVGKKITDAVMEPLAKAEATRDRVMHGKSVKQPEFREAIASVVDFAEAFNALVMTHARFKPFSDLRGFKGAGKSLDRSTTRWVLKGMGLR